MYYGREKSLVTLEPIKSAIHIDRLKLIRKYLSVSNYKVEEVVHSSNTFVVDKQFRKFNGTSSTKVSMPKKPTSVEQNELIIGDGITKLPYWYSMKGKGRTEHTEFGLGINS